MSRDICWVTKVGGRCYYGAQVVHPQEVCGHAPLPHPLCEIYIHRWLLILFTILETCTAGKEFHVGTVRGTSNSYNMVARDLSLKSPKAEGEGVSVINLLATILYPTWLVHYVHTRCWLAQPSNLKSVATWMHTYVEMWVWSIHIQVCKSSACTRTVHWHVHATYAVWSERGLMKRFCMCESLGQCVL